MKGERRVERLAEQRGEVGAGVRGRREGRFWKEWAELV